LKRRKHQDREEEIEINLVPMIDFFVALIPFLLLTAAFVHIGGVPVTIPSISYHDSKSPKETKKSDSVRLAIDIQGDQIVVSAYTDDFEKAIIELQRTFPLEKLSAMTDYLKEAQFKFPKLDLALVHASKKTSYQDLVRVVEFLEKSQIFKKVVLAAGVQS
jgi:biopolymer transport protein ExbD